MKKILLMILGLFSLNIKPVSLNDLNRSDYIGVYTRAYKTLSGIKFGNWGSRPYEYAWAKSIVDVTGKRVIDLGVGLPSQYNWYSHVVSQMKPAYYVGIDYDGRMKNEVVRKDNYEMLYMNIADIKFPDQSFDVAYCISTYEHIPYETFMKAFEETYRILKDDGVLIITLDEEWDKSQPTNYSNGWNTLEQSLEGKGLFKRSKRSFGLPEFLNLVENYFELYLDDAYIEDGVIKSSNDGYIYYDRKDKDPSILNSGLPTNSCVSYAILRKKLK